MTNKVKIITLGLLIMQGSIFAVKSTDGQATESEDAKAIRLAALKTVMENGFFDHQTVGRLAQTDKASHALVNQITHLDLDITNKNCSPDKWSSFFAAYPNIKSLSMKVSKDINPNALSALLALPQFQEKLIELSLSGCKNLTADDFKAIDQLKNLKKFDRGYTSDELEHILSGDLKKSLIELNVSSCKNLSADDFDAIGQLTNLQILDLAGTKIEDDDYLEP